MKGPTRHKPVNKIRSHKVFNRPIPMHHYTRNSDISPTRGISTSQTFHGMAYVLIQLLWFSAPTQPILLNSKNTEHQMGEIAVKTEEGGALCRTYRICIASTLSTLTSFRSKASSKRKKDIKWRKPNAPVAIETFKGKNGALKGKVFSLGVVQASSYDDTCKAILGYFAEKFNDRVHTSIKHKDKAVGMKLLTTPSAPTKVDPGDINKSLCWTRTAKSLPNTK